MNSRFVTSCLLFMILLVAGCNLDEGTATPQVVIAPVDYLTKTKYQKMIIEILYINGFKPTDVTLDNLKAFLGQRINKDEITITLNGIVPQGKNSWNPSDLALMEALYRGQQPRTGTLAVFVFFADAPYSANTQAAEILGAPTTNTSIVIFEKSILDHSGDPGQPSQTDLETVVFEHSFGHLLGLVTNGTPMVVPHEDATNKYHCDDTMCLMHFDYETHTGAARIVATGIPVLTDECLQDILANGGK